ncbi:helix-turn-helix domain-containing protein [Luteibacter sp. CQ10]|uniref:helix-turn-helix domain-containing protein n=1 Tax=Luteibacter sp. CQ10 TaxID=2805821 RepID=UPI0034A1EBCC
MIRSLDNWEREDLLEYLASHMDRSSAPGDLWRRTSLAQPEFYLAFKGSFGMSPSALLQRLRIHHAEKLLLMGKSVEQVASALGYRDSRSLVRAFRQLTGVTPDAWLKRRS